jgi:hypothetical protein
VPRISNHALRQYCIRTGTPLINGLDAKKELQESLKTAEVLSHKEALEQGFTIRQNQKDTLKVWHNTVINTDICAIIRDDVLVTIVLPYKEMFTKPINAKCRKDLKHVNIATKGRH